MQLKTQKIRRSLRRTATDSGGLTGGATPDPISNSEVKTFRADGTAGETLWESRSPPGIIPKAPSQSLLARGFFFLGPVARCRNKREHPRTVAADLRTLFELEPSPERRQITVVMDFEPLGTAVPLENGSDGGVLDL